MVERLRIRFFIDNCVPDSVVGVLRKAGHEVILLRDSIAPDSPDAFVAAVAELHDAVLVSYDKDFRSLAPRIGIGQRRFRKLSRIGFKCSEPQAARRLESALTLIEHEWASAQTAPDKRMMIEIGPTYIRTIR
jgi:predicted nuclease of predicted toxin-antitoxin system